MDRIGERVTQCISSVEVDQRCQRRIYSIRAAWPSMPDCGARRLVQEGAVQRQVSLQRIECDKAAKRWPHWAARPACFTERGERKTVRMPEPRAETSSSSGSKWHAVPFHRFQAKRATVHGSVGRTPWLARQANGASTVVNALGKARGLPAHSLKMRLQSMLLVSRNRSTAWQCSHPWCIRTLNPSLPILTRQSRRQNRRKNRLALDKRSIAHVGRHC